jgi:hypothetical protein
MGKKKIVEPEPETDTEEIEEQEEQIVAPVQEKKKKVLTQKQLDALAEGRKKGAEKLREHQTRCKEKTAVKKEIKENILKAKEKEVDDLKKINDYVKFKSSIDDLNDKFSSFLEEKKQRQKLKEQNLVEKTIKKELPNTMASIMMKDRIDKELSNNPFFGRV